MENTITGVYQSNDSDWLVEDVTFDEGAFFASEEHHMTILTIHLPFEIPTFALEKARWIDRVLEIAGYEEADFKPVKDVCDDFDIKAPEGQDMGSFFNQQMLEFLRSHELYHLESKGDAVMIFKFDRLAGALEVERMVDWGRQFADLLQTRKAA